MAMRALSGGYIKGIRPARGGQEWPPAGDRRLHAASRVPGPAARAGGSYARPWATSPPGRTRTRLHRRSGRRCRQRGVRWTGWVGRGRVTTAPPAPASPSRWPRGSAVPPLPSPAGPPADARPRACGCTPRRGRAAAGAGSRPPRRFPPPIPSPGCPSASWAAWEVELLDLVRRHRHPLEDQPLPRQRARTFVAVHLGVGGEDVPDVELAQLLLRVARDVDPGRVVVPEVVDVGGPVGREVLRRRVEERETRVAPGHHERDVPGLGDGVEDARERLLLQPDLHGVAGRPERAAVGRAVASRASATSSYVRGLRIQRVLSAIHDQGSSSALLISAHRRETVVEYSFSDFSISPRETSR